VTAALGATAITPDGVDDVQRQGRLGAHDTARGAGARCACWGAPPPAWGSHAPQQKLTHATATYQDQPKGQQSCAACFNFQPPDACKFVQGAISPNGWCLLFAPKA